MGQRVASLRELPVGGVRLVRVQGRRLALFRTSDGVFALDNQCPHEGYGLTRGQVRDDGDGDGGATVTCNWHNWKFRLSDGACVLGEEDVRAHPVRVEGDDVVVDVVDPSPDELRPRLVQSLRRGIERARNGHVARDVVRLLQAGATPAALVGEAVTYGAPRAEFGWGHALASATDCLALVERYDGDHRALPVVQAIAGIAEVELRRPHRPQPRPATSLPPSPAAAFRQLVDEERGDEAEALLLAALEAGLGPEQLRPWFVGAVSDHHLGFGHMAIYTQKAFTLLEELGWERAPIVLAPLVPAIVLGTREDRLPYMRRFMGALAAVDLDELAAAPADVGWADDDRRLREALLGRDPVAFVAAAVTAVREGAGVDGMLDAVVLAASERLLRHDPTVDFDPSLDFGWLDITHGVTYAHAARWAWRHHPGPDAARVALFSAFLAHYSGRAEWRRGAAASPKDRVDVAGGSLQDAVEAQQPDAAVAAALSQPPDEAAAQLERAALADRAASFIMSAHFVKTAHAAACEAATTGSSLPLAGAARFMSAPRLERFVAFDVSRAIDFVGGKLPEDDL